MIGLKSPRKGKGKERHLIAVCTPYPNGYEHYGCLLSVDHSNATVATVKINKHG